MSKKKSGRNKKKADSRKSRYGMGAKEWAKFQKTNPKEAHELRMKVDNPSARISSPALRRV